MGNGNGQDPPAGPHKYKEEISKRKRWYYECQLRRINYDSFRGVNAEGKTAGSVPDPYMPTLLKLISEEVAPPPGSRSATPARVYLDSRQPVWTDAMRSQRDAFAATILGRTGDFTHHVQPVKLAKAIDDLKIQFESAPSGSCFDSPASLNEFKRKTAFTDGGELSHAIARMQIIAEKPWLMPELFTLKNENYPDISDWISSGEHVLRCMENELQAVHGNIVSDMDNSLSDADIPLYTKFISELYSFAATANFSDVIKVKYLETVKGKETINIRIKTAGHDFKHASSLDYQQLAKYWVPAIQSPVMEVYVNKANSDMGLCQLMRTLYLYGTLPPDLATDEQLTWRKKTFEEDKFNAFYDKIRNQTAVINSPDLQKRLDAVQAKLKVWFSQSMAFPRGHVPGFSSLSQEVLKQAILSFKFWLDEPWRAIVKDADDDDKKGINKAREDIGKGDAFVEMEYWSENHYIMFASSEYLAGQLWENENFQPAKPFLEASEKELGIKTGKERRARGKARSLRWLNNKLQFGWTEFNSHGYYREHFFALINLVDFALDNEVKKKAEIVMDLLLFDIIRLSHKGSMGAAGGRSQFKSKMCGRDNASSDVSELILGSKGIFLDIGGEGGTSFATSTYIPPAVLMEMGINPPAFAFTDKSRVSIGFDDAPKYGIQYSQKSDQKESVYNAYTQKRNKHSAGIQHVYDAIAKSHSNYGAAQDDTVFWWSMSAFYNKQNVRNTFDCIDKYGLSEVPVFKGFVTSLISTILPLIHKFAGAGIGGALTATFIAGIPGAVAGFFANKAIGVDLEENSSNELSLFLEGSSRTRCNINSFRSPEYMLSSIQNFRPGQLNFQTNVNQATLSADVNVFTSSGFSGLEISPLESGLFGGLAGAGLGLVAGPGGAVVGGVIGLIGGAIVGEVSRGSNPFGDDEDGPGWWTGYWSTPMVIQHERAAILVYNFHFMQRRLTRAGTHVWFPKSGFTQTEERRTSNYQDDNFALWDITDIGPKGYWLFGKIVHPVDPADPANIRESYIGVFSNQSPDWISNDHYVYKDRITEKTEDAAETIDDGADKILKDLEDENKAGKDTIKNTVKASIEKFYNLYISKEDWVNTIMGDLMQSGGAVSGNDPEKLRDLAGQYIDKIYHSKVWDNALPEDIFLEKDWFAGGDNIWIEQMGSREEYGSFEQFKDRVSKTRILVDDVDNPECTYDSPKPDGTVDTIKFQFDDGGSFTLNGATFQDEYYPRFDNPFIHGNLAEWGQREYVIEYNGLSVLHDFSDLENVIRREDISFTEEEKEEVRGLVIYLRTADEEMEVFTVAKADVMIGCDKVATDEVIGAGKVKENVNHDSEWIYFDHGATINPDMTVNISHHIQEGKGEDDSEWKMTFRLKALMGDRSLKDCTMKPIGSATYYFRENSHGTGSLPFSVQTDKWRSWKKLNKIDVRNDFRLISQTGMQIAYFDHVQILGIDKDRNLIYHHLDKCGFISSAHQLASVNKSPGSGNGLVSYAVETIPNYLYIFLISDSDFYIKYSVPDEQLHTKPWIKMEISYQPMKKAGIFNISVPDFSVPPIPISIYSGSSFQTIYNPESPSFPMVCLSGSDGNFYLSSHWPLDTPGCWRIIKAGNDFQWLYGSPFQWIAGYLFSMDKDHHIRRFPLPAGMEDLSGSWEMLPVAEFKVSHFKVVASAQIFQVIAQSAEGGLWSLSLQAAAAQNVWVRIGASTDFRAGDNNFCCVSSTSEQVHLFAAGIDNKLYSSPASGNWESPMSVVSPDSQTFTTGSACFPAAISRVEGQVEVFVADADGFIWKTWWS